MDDKVKEWGESLKRKTNPNECPDFDKWFMLTSPGILVSMLLGINFPCAWNSAGEMEHRSSKAYFLPVCVMMVVIESAV